MILAVALSENGGMTFNKRRQSRDRELIRDLISLSRGGRLCISEFSRKLFSEEPVFVTDNPDALSDSDVFFCERGEDMPHSGVSRLIIYRWNEVYPSDGYFTYGTDGFTLAETVDFAGYSHKKITREVWERKL